MSTIATATETATAAAKPAPTLQTDDTLAKTRDLCAAIVAQPDFAEIKRRIDLFLADELLKFKFQMVNEKGNMLMMKTQSGQPVGNEEFVGFQALRDELFANPVAREFMEAQDAISQFQTNVQNFFNKTFELGRLPTAEDLDDGSCCDTGCGCH
jgi:cell fate (sporulation/competence/biofilm development) regulator YlbF (YheA/YmcA/DUF963 family)